MHHRKDGCRLCLYSFVPALMDVLPATQRTDLLSFDGGASRGEPCEAFAYHGYNGIERRRRQDPA